MTFKKPKLGGVSKARETFNKLIKRPPSDKLIKIVEDVLVENEKSRKKPDVAAKGHEPEADA